MPRPTNLQRRIDRRKKGLFKKAAAWKMQADQQAASKVAVILQVDGLYYIFTSDGDPSWPPAINDIVRRTLPFDK